MFFCSPIVSHELYLGNCYKRKGTQKPELNATVLGQEIGSHYLPTHWELLVHYSSDCWPSATLAAATASVVKCNLMVFLANYQHLTDHIIRSTICSSNWRWSSIHHFIITWPRIVKGRCCEAMKYLTDQWIRATNLCRQKGQALKDSGTALHDDNQVIHMMMLNISIFVGTLSKRSYISTSLILLTHNWVRVPTGKLVEK